MTTSGQKCEEFSYFVDHVRAWPELNWSFYLGSWFRFREAWRLSWCCNHQSVQSRRAWSSSSRVAWLVSAFQGPQFRRGSQRGGKRNSERQPALVAWWYWQHSCKIKKKMVWPDQHMMRQYDWSSGSLTSQPAVGTSIQTCRSVMETRSWTGAQLEMHCYTPDLLAQTSVFIQFRGKTLFCSARIFLKF
jgi:hypothetical protein